jgi:signal transduction histidine kinase
LLLDLSIGEKSRLRYLLSILILSFLAVDKLAADASLPYSYQKFENHKGGRLVLAEDYGEKISYLIKPEWIGGSEVLLSWRGIKKENARGGSLGGIDILDAIPYENQILMIWEERQTLYIGLSDSLENISKVSGIYPEWQGGSKPEITWLMSSEKIYLIIDNNLYSISIQDQVQSIFISLNVEDVCIEKSTKELLYLTSEGGWGSVFRYKGPEQNDELVYRNQIHSSGKLFSEGEKNILVHYSSQSVSTQINVFDSSGKVLNEEWIECRGDLIDANRNGFVFLSGESTEYVLNLEDLKTQNITETDIPTNFFEPIGLKCTDDRIFVLFRNGLISFDSDGDMHSKDFYPLGEYFDVMPEVNLVRDEYLILSSKKNSIVFKKKDNNLWFLYSAIDQGGKFLLPVTFVIILLILIQLYRHNRRLLNTLLDLPSSGMVFVIDQNGKLKRANDSGKAFLGISDIIPLRRHFEYYCVMEYTSPILDLVKNSLSSQGNFNQRISLVIENEPREWFCTVLPLRNVTGVFRGIVLTGIDITEELEKKRINNWAQLAHDMQTNLSTIRLNAEQIEQNDDPALVQRKNKILHQVKVLINRVRDIVTVGRSDELDKATVNAASVCIEARVEFDEIMFPEIDFELKILNISVVCDKAKMIRAVRNAIENAIKAFKGAPGYIRISCYDDKQNTYFKVEDDGPGMTEETKKKMLKPYFTTAKKTGGGGIGTMIMQHVMELHGGHIVVESEEGTGTSVTFVLPKFNREQKKK